MNITYIHHSCFLVETATCYYIFDYEKGTLPPLNTDKPIIVLSSHRHRDHYNPEIFTILPEAGMKQIQPVLSSDIRPRLPERCAESTAILTPVTVKPGNRYTLGPIQTVTTYRSTDEGVAFLLEDSGKLIYHAGDLNDWVWEGEEPSYNKQMTAAYRAEIDKVADHLNGRKVDVAFVVLDPRQEDDYARGMLYFLEKVDTHKVYPMHYWEQPQIITRFLKEYPQYGDRIVITK